MPSDVPFPDGTEGLPYYPPGPALLYVPDPGSGLASTGERAWQVDAGVPAEGGSVSVEQAARDRRVLRALLEHALWLLDRAEGRAS